MSSVTIKQPWTFHSVHRRRLPWCQRHSVQAGAVLLLFVVFLAGCRDGAVVANGRVLIDGAPAPVGRLTLNPVGAGIRAYALVEDDGAFVLQSNDGAQGANPGQYHVVFQHRLDERTRSLVGGQVGGELTADEITVIYRSPKDKPYAIPESNTEELVIDVRRQQGWERLFSE
jgi:hypothetical protein